MSCNEILFIPLGGCGEVGNNLYLIDYCNTLIAIDAGFKLVIQELPGILATIPNISYIIKNYKRFRGFFITHAHDDHIGALRYIHKFLPSITVYSSELTNRIIQAKFDETKPKPSNIKFINVQPRQTISLGEVKVKFIKTTHSIPESYAILVITPIGNLLFTGDIKVDPTPLDDKGFDFYMFSKLGEEKLLALFSDSTNATKKGYTPSEKDVYPSLYQAISSSKGTVVFATFASNIYRIRQAIDIAIRLDRKVSFSGRTLEKIVDIATNLGYLDIPSDLVVPIDKVSQIDRSKLLLIATGSQGETMSALYQIAYSTHKFFTLNPGDTVIISASIIPGHEREVYDMINRLYMLGAEVYYGSLHDVHASGHASEKELKLILAMTKPQFFFPVHGEYHMFMAHKEIALQMGIPPENIYVPQNHDIISITREKISKIDNLGFKHMLVDNSLTYEMDEQLLRDRVTLSEHGILVANILFAKAQNKLFLNDIDLTSKGLMISKNASSVMQDIELNVAKLIMSSLKANGEIDSIKFKVKRYIEDLIYS